VEGGLDSGRRIDSQPSDEASQLVVARIAESAAACYNDQRGQDGGELHVPGLAQGFYKRSAKVSYAVKSRACLIVRMKDVVDSRWQSVWVIATLVRHVVEPSLGKTVRCDEDLL